MRHAVDSGRRKHRMEALNYVILMAMLVYIVLQRRARKSLEHAVKPLAIAGGKTTFSPAGSKILELLRPVKILCVKEGRTVVKRFLPENYHRLARVLNQSGLDWTCMSKDEAHNVTLRGNL